MRTGVRRHLLPECVCGGAQATLGCSAYCGDHGLCAQGPDGQWACTCECGWVLDAATGACTRPQGFCSLFGSGSNQSEGLVRYYPAPPAPPAPPLVCNASGSGGGASKPQSVPADATTGERTRATEDGFQARRTEFALWCTNSSASGALRVLRAGACPSGYGLGASGTTCGLCSPGWAGFGCSLCQEDRACQAHRNSSSARCVRSVVYQQKSLWKNYTCAPKDATSQALLGATMAFSCSTLPPSDVKLNASGEQSPPRCSGHGGLVRGLAHVPSTLRASPPHCVRAQPTFRCRPAGAAP